MTAAGQPQDHGANERRLEGTIVAVGESAVSDNAADEMEEHLRGLGHIE